MTRFQLPADDRFLKASECAERLHCAEGDFRRIARDSVHLGAGKVWRGRLCFWLQSSLVRFMHFESARIPELHPTDRVAKGGAPRGPAQPPSQPRPLT